MTWLRTFSVVALVLGATTGVAVWSATSAFAQVPASCTWEYGGVAEAVPAPCTEARPVTVTNTPDVKVTNGSTERVPVAAVCEDASQDCMTGEVTVSNTTPVPVHLHDGATTAWFVAFAALTAGCLFCSVLLALGRRER